MKYKLNQEQYDSLDDTQKGEYEENGGVFTLKLEGHEEDLIPKGKKDLAEQHRKEAEKRLADAEAREQKLVKDLENAGNSKGEIAKVRKEYEAQLEKIQADHKEKEEAVKAEQHKSMIDAHAEKFARDNFTVPSAIKRLFKDRLVVEEVEGQPVLRAKEEDGKISVRSVSDIEKDFLANEEFSSIVKVSKGSGGGADKNLYEKNRSGSAPKDVDILTAKPKDLVGSLKGKVGQ